MSALRFGLHGTSANVFSLRQCPKGALISRTAERLSSDHDISRRISGLAVIGHGFAGASPRSHCELCPQAV